MKKNFKKTTFFIVVFLTVGFFLKLFFFKAPPDYYTLTSLPADFVFDCQQISVITNNDWCLLAAFFHEKKISSSLSKILETSESLNKSSFFSYPRSIMTKNEYKRIKRKTAGIKKISFFFGPHFTYPLGQYFPEFTDTFGADRDGGSRKHQGIDIFAPEHTPIYAVCSGKIIKLGWNSLGGKRIGIRDTKGFYYYYAHLCDYAPDIHNGDKITAGQLIGFVGHTGNAENTPDHLHFGIQAPSNEWINPFNFLVYWSRYTITD